MIDIGTYGSNAECYIERTNVCSRIIGYSTTGTQQFYNTGEAAKDEGKRRFSYNSKAQNGVLNCAWIDTLIDPHACLTLRAYHVHWTNCVNWRYHVWRNFCTVIRRLQFIAWKWGYYWKYRIYSILRWKNQHYYELMDIADCFAFHGQLYRRLHIWLHLAGHGPSQNHLRFLCEKLLVVY